MTSLRKVHDRKELPPRLKFLIESIFEMRESGWRARREDPLTKKLKQHRKPGPNAAAVARKPASVGLRILGRTRSHHS